MLPVVEREFHKLERCKVNLLRRLDGWSAERLVKQPSPGAWSAAVLFLRLHHDHHRPQLARIAKASRPPI